jgi:hypothetical protein
MSEPIVVPPTLRHLFPNGARMAGRFKPSQVAPFCEQLVKTMNRMLPARFTLTREGDSALVIRVEINHLALTGTTQTDTPSDAACDGGCDECACPDE